MITSIMEPSHNAILSEIRVFYEWLCIKAVSKMEGVAFKLFKAVYIEIVACNFEDLSGTDN